MYHGIHMEVTGRCWVLVFAFQLFKGRSFAISTVCTRLADLLLSCSCPLPSVIAAEHWDYRHGSGQSNPGSHTCEARVYLWNSLYGPDWP